MTTPDQDALLENVLRRYDSRRFAWTPAVCLDVTSVPLQMRSALPSDKPLPAPHILTLLANGHVYLHEPSQKVLAQLMAYYDAPTPDELKGRPFWVLTKREHSYKVFGARELEE